MPSTVKQHTLWQSILLHLLPGVLMTAAYVWLIPLFQKAELPGLLGMSVIVILVLVPLELGCLLVLGKKHNQRFSLKGIVLFREKTPAGQLVLFVAGVLAISVAVIAIAGPFWDEMLKKWFGWLPGWYFLADDLALYSKPVQLITCLATLLFTTILGPWVEELYFRGYLLPRIQWMKAGAPIFEAFFFALYHFWSPWQLISRFLAVLPLAAAVNRKRDIRIGIWAHCLLNAIGSMGLLLVFLQS